MQEQAEELDSIPVSERKSKPLFGIPLSVKENEFIAGENVCMGLSSKLGYVCEKESPRVKVMYHFIIHTDIKVCLMTGDNGYLRVLKVANLSGVMSKKFSYIV